MLCNLYKLQETAWYFTGNANSSINHVYDMEMVWVGSVTGLMML